MTISNDWRLTPSLDAFVVSGAERKYIYLVATEKKQYKSAVEKTIGSPYKEIHIELNEFELKFESPDSESSLDPVVMVRNPEVLPDDSWYVVSNFYYPRYLDFFLELPSSGGCFPDITFEAIFSEIPENVSVYDNNCFSSKLFKLIYSKFIQESNILLISTSCDVLKLDKFNEINDEQL